MGPAGHVSQLFIYPIKSLGGIPLLSSAVNRRGLNLDRRWMLVDSEALFLTQRTLPSLVTFQPRLDAGRLFVDHESGGTIEIPLQTSGESRLVSVWKSQVEAEVVSDSVSAWFSEALHRPCELVYMPEGSLRPTHPDFSEPGDHVSFADGFPILVTNQASLDSLNQRLDLEAPMDRFRPNIVAEGAPAWSEDTWSHLTIGETHYRVAKPCGRCQVIATDQRTGERGTEPLTTLATFRNRGNSVDFGINLIPNEDGFVQIGDPILST